MMQDINFTEYLIAPKVDLGIEPTYQRRFLSRCATPQKRNSLWENWIVPSLLVDERNLHVPIHETKLSNFSHHGSVRASEMLRAGFPAQIAFSLFSNPLLQPAFQYADGKWQRPKERCAVGAFWVFTFEADEAALQTQCDWIWRNRPSGQTRLATLDQHLARRYRDYRGYTVVWSGNKSLHIHLLFSCSHLDRQVTVFMAKQHGRSAEAQLRDHWKGDIDQHALWDYYAHSWDALAGTIKEVTQIEDKFDNSLRHLHQKRRLPWGLRAAETDNDLGFNTDDLIPQIVLEERLRKTSAKGAEGYFLSAAQANALPPTQIAKPSSGRHTIDLYADELLPALTDYLRTGWGSDYPKPAALTEEANGLTVWFHNSVADQNPSSFIAEDYRSMLWRGRDVPDGQRYKALPDTSFTLGELLVELQAEIDASNGGAYQSGDRQNTRRYSPALRLFAKHLRTTAPHLVRSAMSFVAWDVSQRYARNMIVSTEGAGKSTAAIRDAGRLRLDDMATNYFANKLVAPENGFQVVAAGSYKQAKEHYQAYYTWWSEQTDQASIDYPAPVLLQSFAEHYRRYCSEHGYDRIGYADALRMGFNSVVEAVATKQPDVFSDVSAVKNKQWLVAGANNSLVNGFYAPTKVILFTSHDMAQEFNQPSVSKAWLHPDFDITALTDPLQWRDLALAFKLYRVIHDEASLTDLVDVELARDVKTAKKFRKLVNALAGQDWSKVRQSRRYQIFMTRASKKMKKLGFHSLCRIISIGFTADDQISVDFHAHPFGINNADDAMYLSTHGKSYYVKPRAWWMAQNARVLLTTTEALVAQLARCINKRGDASWVPEIRVHRLDRNAFVTPDSIGLRRDKRACKTHINALVQDRLQNGIDVVITDMADDFAGQVSTHVSARGRNDLQDASIGTVLTFLSKDEYCRLNVIGQRFGLDSVFHDFYRDRLNQAVGRNRGLRKNHQAPCDHEIIVSPTLYRCLGGADFFGVGRYPAYLVS